MGEPTHDHRELADSILPWPFPEPNEILADCDELCAFGVPHEAIGRILKTMLDVGREY